MSDDGPEAAATAGDEPPAGSGGGGGPRWVPRGAFVFLAIVAALVIVFVLVRPDWFSSSSQDSVPPELSFHKTLADIGDDDGIRLSDDNATSQSFTMTVPVDSKLENTRLALAGHTQVADPSTVFLRVLVDGTSAYVHQLPTGDHDLTADIGVPASALEDGSVRIQVRLTGGIDQQECNLDESTGALVVLDPGGTNLHARLDKSLHSVRDVVAGLDHDVTLDLAVPPGSKPWFETAARLATALTQSGHDVSYADVTDHLSDDKGSHVLVGPDDALDKLGWKPTEGADDSGGGVPASVQVGAVGSGTHLAVVEPTTVAPALLTTSALATADAAGNAPRSLAPERLSGSEVTLESLGVDTSVQQVTDTRSWRASYSLADLPGGGVPDRVKLQVQVPVTSDDSRWLVQAQLNGQVVGSKRLPGSDTAQTVQVAIPPGLEQLRNSLVISLLRDRDVGGCNVRQTQYSVQVLPSSGLVLGGNGAGFTQVPAVYAPGFVVDLPSSSAEHPAASLRGLVPTLAELSGWQQQPTFGWDAAPADVPFLYVGEPPAGVTAPVQVSDGRLTAHGLDLQSFEDGLVVQCASTAAVHGVVLTPVGMPDSVVPPYGRESARLVTGGGGGAVVTASGEVVTTPPVRTEPSG